MGSCTTKEIRIYTRRWCGYCFEARRLCDRLGVEFEEISLDRKPELRREIAAKAGNWRTLPMVFVGDRFIGGYREIAAMNRRGELEALLRAE